MTRTYWPGGCDAKLQTSKSQPFREAPRPKSQYWGTARSDPPSLESFGETWWHVLPSRVAGAFGGVHKICNVIFSGSRPGVTKDSSKVFWRITGPLAAGRDVPRSDMSAYVRLFSLIFAFREKILFAEGSGTALPSQKPSRTKSNQVKPSQT